MAGRQRRRRGLDRQPHPPGGILNAPVFHNDGYGACGHATDTTRKAAVIAEDLVDNPLSGVTITDPVAATKSTESLVGRLHTSAYVRAVRTGHDLLLAESQGFTWDEGTYPMAVAHNSGLVAAVDSVLLDGGRWAGSLSSGLHHASADSGKGFCTFNGLAVAAQRAHDHGARRILVLDFDAHCGGGTYSMIGDLGVVQIDLSTSSFDWWTRRGDDTESDLEFTTPEHYLPKVHRALQLAERLGPWDIVIYNSGMDPFNTGVPASALERREYMVAHWAARHRAPVVVTVAGGYTWGNVPMRRIVELHRATFRHLSAVL